MIQKLVTKAGLAVGAVGFAAPVAFADSGKSADEKPKSIYDDEVPIVSHPLPGYTEASKPAENVLKKSGEVLENELGLTSRERNGYIYRVNAVLQNVVHDSRESLNAFLNRSGEVSTSLVNRYITGERNIVETVAGLAAPNEDVLAGSIYVLIAGLTGSIVARRRSFPLRAVTPVVFGWAGFAYFLPGTFQNTRSLAWKYEQEQAPALATRHEEAGKTVDDLREQSVQLYGQGEQTLKNGLGSLRKFIKDWTGF